MLRGPPVTLYLDTSSLVKLYVADRESDSVRQLVEEADIVATAALCRDAGDLAERHALRGYDSVHLAAFLHVARAIRPRGR